MARSQEGMLQGFVTVTTFTNWQKNFRWDSMNEVSFYYDSEDVNGIKVERAMGVEKADDVHIAERVAMEIRRKILVRCQIEIIDPGYLPRTQRKSQRVFDHRNEK